MSPHKTPLNLTQAGIHKRPDPPYRILITDGLGSGKTNALLNLMKHQQDIHKIYLQAKDPFKLKY